MIRKLFVTSTLSIIPGQAIAQISFAFIITLFSLVLSMKVSPFIYRQLGQLHIISLTSQVITLFVALIIETQQLSSDSYDPGAQSVNGQLLDAVLILANTSIFFLPVLLYLHEAGYTEKTHNLISDLSVRARTYLGLHAKEHKILWPLATSDAPHQIGTITERPIAPIFKGDSNNRVPAANNKKASDSMSAHVIFFETNRSLQAASSESESTHTESVLLPVEPASAVVEERLPFERMMGYEGYTDLTPAISMPAVLSQR